MRATVFDDKWTFQVDNGKIPKLHYHFQKLTHR